MGPSMSKEDTVVAREETCAEEARTSFQRDGGAAPRELKPEENLSQKTAPEVGGNEDIACEARLFYTEGPALAANLRKLISSAYLLSKKAVIIIPHDKDAPPVGAHRRELDVEPLRSAEQEDEKYRGAFAALARRVVSSDFLDSSKNAKYMPFAESGILRQIRQELYAVGATDAEEMARLSAAVYASAYVSAHTCAAKRAARVACGIAAGTFDPYPNQPGGLFLQRQRVVVSVDFFLFEK